MDATKSVQNGENSGARNRAQPDAVTARALSEALELDPQCGPGVLQMGNYIVTSGTGEGEFAYRVADVRRWLRDYKPVPREDREDGSDEPYSKFCRAVDPVESRRIAFCAARELHRRICKNGTCTRILTDAEYDRVTR